MGRGLFWRDEPASPLGSLRSSVALREKCIPGPTLLNTGLPRRFAPPMTAERDAATTDHPKTDVSGYNLPISAFRLPLLVVVALLGLEGKSHDECHGGPEIIKEE